MKMNIVNTITWFKDGSAQVDRDFFFLSIISALMRAAAYIFPEHFFYLVFLFPIPLYFLLFEGCLTFFAGCIWGTVFYGIYGVGWLWFWYLYCPTPFLGIFLFIFYLIYISFVTGLWFWATSFTVAFLQTRKIKAPVVAILLFALFGTIYFFFIEQYLFIILGVCEGDPLSAFLVPLVVGVPELFLDAGSLSVTFRILVAIGFIALFIRRAKRGHLSSALLASVLLLTLGTKKTDKPMIAINSCLFAVPRTNLDTHIPDRVRTIAGALEQTISQDSSITTIIMPESMLPFCVNTKNQMLELLCGFGPLAERFILCGGHREDENNHLLNTFYIIHKGRIIYHYDKQHLTSFTENIEKIRFLPQVISRLFFLQNSVEFSPGMVQRKKVSIPGLNGDYYPCICSELFFAADLADGEKNIPILCLLNDSWFSHYLQKLMFLNACTRAIAWQKSIVYVSHRIIRIIHKNGSSDELVHIEIG